MKNLNFYGLDSSNNRQLRMSIDTSGNIGLGIADPTTRLEIVGDLSLNGSIYHNGILFTPSETATTNIYPTTDISLNNLKVHGDLSANDASFNVIDVSAIFIQGRDLIGENVPTALDTLKELADALDNSANFATNVTNTLSTIQSDLSTKQDTISTNDLSLGDISGLYTQLNSKQDTIADGDLTIAKTSGLQTALDAKQAIITTNDLSLGDISGLYAQLDSKGGTIADGDLTIAKTSGLQTALDSKQPTITTNDLSLGDISGLYTQLDSKQDTIADGDLTIAKTSGLQTALDAKQATITTNDLSLGDISGLYTQLDSKQDNIADGDLTIAKTSGLQTALDAKQATITESVDVSLNDLKVHGDLSANDASFNVLKAAQVLINGEDLSGTIYTKINTDISNAISNLVDNAPIALDTLKELADALDNSANFASNVTVRLNAIETDVAGKQNTIADGDLTIAKTSGLQTALNSKQDTITTNDLSLGDISGLYTQLNSKQNTIADGDLTIAKTSGLQTALDAKQATITTNDLSLGDISGLYTQLNSKQNTIADGDLTIAKTAGLQTALDSKQATITTNDLSLGDISGLYTQLANKQDTIADGGLTIAKTSGLQTALDAKQDTITTNDLSLGDISGLYTQLNSKQNTIADGDLTIAKTSGLQTALNSKQDTITTNDLSLGDISGLYTQLANKQDTIADGDLTIEKTSGLQTALNSKQATITESVDVSLNNLKVHGDLSANDASFNVVDISSINTSSTSFMNSIIPNANDTYSLGSITNVWKDIYIGPGSLYIDGQKVIESDSSTIVVAADQNQNMKINTTGSGVLQLESAQGLEITSTGSGNITIGSTSTGTVRITDNIILSSGVEIQNETDTTVKINDGLNVTGAYLQNGTNINTIYAALSSPTLTGTPLAPTASSGTNTTQIATTAFVTTAIDDLIGGAPGALDTLNELAQALDNSGSFASNITTKVGSIETQLATKQDTISTNDLSLGDISGLYTQLATIPTNNNELTNGSGYITASSTDTLTNKTISISQITNLQTEIDSKQDTLTAGTNITITGSTISASSLWSGSSDIYYTGGNVGIGTTSPQTKLHIKGSSNDNCTIKLTNSNAGTGYMYIQRNDDGKSYVLNQSNHPLILGGNNNTSQLYLKEDGNVGIGESSPSYKLDVNGTGRFVNNVTMNDNLTVDDYVGIGTTASSSYSLDVSGTANFTGDVSMNGVSINGEFTINNQTSFKDNVGIGAGVPDTILDVFGEVQFNTHSMTTSEMTTNSGIIKFANLVKSINADRSVHYEGTDIRIYVEGDLTTLYNNTYGTTGQLPSAYREYDGSSYTGRYFYSKGAKPSQDVLDRIIALVTDKTVFKDGNVGIGESSPSYKLDVNGTANFTGDVSMNDVSMNDVSMNGGLTVSNLAHFEDNVGIGTTASSSYRLDVNGQVNIETTTNALRIVGGGSSDYQIFGKDAVKGLYLKTTSTTVTDYIAWFRSNSQEYVLVVCPTGNVGIGVSSPSYKLDVNGTANFTGDVSMNDVSMNGGLTVSNQAHFEDNVGIGETNPDSKLHIKGSSNDNCTIKLTNSIAGTGYMYIQRNDDGKSYVLNQSNHPLILGANNNTSQLYLKEDGNIGIGVSSPSYKLDVNGTGRFVNSVTMNDNLTVDDYVGIGTTASSSYSLDVNGTANFTGDVSMNDVSMNGVLTISNSITTDVGYPYYQSLGDEYIVNPPSTTSTIYGVNITAMNKRTRASYASAEACVSTWTTRTFADSNTWNNICWAPELSIFVAVAQNGTNRVMTSPDGITWTAISAPAYSWFALCWSPELSLLVSMSIAGDVMTSSDGNNWSYQTDLGNREWVSVCWAPELSKFVAVSQSGTYRVVTSSDGITWSSSSSTTTTAVTDNSLWRNVCWSPELSIFVAVAESGDYRVMTSSDGITWTAQTSFSQSGMSTSPWTDVCWSPELSLFVAVGRTTSYIVMTSPDGINWTLRTSPVNGSFYSVCWSPELSLFVSVSYGSTNFIYSPDGINWTSGSTPLSTTWYSICWAPELSIFAVLGRTNKVLTSAIGMPNSKSVVKALPSQMSVDASGNVGIGTSSPSYKLDVSGTSNFTGGVGIGTPPRTDVMLDINQPAVLYGMRVVTGTTSTNYYSARMTGDGDDGLTVWANGSVEIGSNSSTGGTNSLRITSVPNTNSAQIYATGANYGILVQTAVSDTKYCARFTGSTSKGLIVQSNGRTTNENTTRSLTTPSLEVKHGHLKVSGYWDGWTSTGPISIDAEHDIYTPAIHQSSDRRIKNNIVDVPDYLALTYVRNIPCCYYNYIARPKQTNTIGFIAQEVKEVFPIAVNIITKCIPNIMQTVSGEWIERDDEKFDFSSNFFTDISFGTYKFRLKENISDTEYIEEEVSMNDDRSFTFKKIYYDVFCYGIEVDDFHALDKSKLFAVNFSATQEIDRIQQQHIIDISNAQATIQQHETTIQQQQLEIENLKLVNQDMNNQLNMIKEHLGL